jgi:hypothetical protein
MSIPAAIGAAHLQVVIRSRQIIALGWQRRVKKKSRTVVLGMRQLSRLAGVTAKQRRPATAELMSSLTL